MCWVLWSLVVFDPDDDLTRNDVAWFLIRDFLRFSPWSGKFLAPFIAYCESCVQDIETVVLVIRIS